MRHGKLYHYHKKRGGSTSLCFILGVVFPAFLSANKIWKISLSTALPSNGAGVNTIGWFRTASFMFFGATGTGTTNFRAIEFDILGNIAYARGRGTISVSHISLYKSSNGDCFYVAAGAIYYNMLPICCNCYYTLEEASSIPSDAVEITIES